MQGTSLVFLGCKSCCHHSPGQARGGHCPWWRQEFGAWKVTSHMAVVTVLSPCSVCCCQVIYNTCNELRALEKFVLLSPAMKESVAFPWDKEWEVMTAELGKQVVTVFNLLSLGEPEWQLNTGEVISSAFIWAIFHIYGCAQCPGGLCRGWDWVRSPQGLPVACLGAGVGTSSLGALSLPVEIFTAVNNELENHKPQRNFHSPIKLTWQVWSL